MDFEIYWTWLFRDSLVYFILYFLPYACIITKIKQKSFSKAEEYLQSLYPETQIFLRSYVKCIIWRCFYSLRFNIYLVFLYISLFDYIRIKFLISIQWNTELMINFLKIWYHKHEKFIIKLKSYTDSIVSKFWI